MFTTFSPYLDRYFLKDKKRNTHQWSGIGADPEVKPPLYEINIEVCQTLNNKEMNEVSTECSKKNQYI